MKINFEKLKELFLKYKVLIALFFGTLFFMFACFWAPFSIFAWAFAGIIFIFCTFQEILSCIIYFMLFSRNTIFFVGIAILGFIAILIKYIIDLVKKRVKTYLIPLIFTTAFCFIFCLRFFKISFDGFCQGLLFIGLLYLIYLIFCCKEKIDLTKSYNYLFYGIFVSAVVSLILYCFPNAKITYYDSYGFVYQQIRSLILSADVDCRRLTLLTYHTNHLASFCMYVMTFNVYYFMNNNYSDDKKSYLKNIFMFVFCSVIGFYTISKAFLIIFALMISILLLYYLIKLKKKAFIVIVPLVIVLLILALILKDEIKNVFNRFFTYDKSTNIFSSITTGRTEIWEQYIDNLLSSPWRFLFGNGIFAKEIVAITPHNLYLEVWYRVGIIGIILLGVLGYLYARELDCKITFSIKRCVPLAIFLVHSLQETNFDERFLFLIFAIMLLFRNDKSKKEVEDLKSSDAEQLENKLTLESDVK